MREEIIPNLRAGYLLLCVLACHISSCSMNRADLLPKSASVIRVEDGDTVFLGEGTVVRLLGINAPERDQPLFTEARQLCEELLLGKSVRLEYDVEKRDKMKQARLLAYIFVGDVFVNEEMVRRGLARSDVRSPNVKYEKRIKSAEAEAKNAGLGMWNYIPNARFVGNKNSKAFHKSDCKYVIEIDPRYRIEFDERGAAKDQGYRPCKSCKP